MNIRTLFAWTIVAACCAPCVTWGQPLDSAGARVESPGSALRADQPAPAAPFQFRRVFAPADRVADWPLGSEKYMPIEAAEFERLAKMLQGGGQPSKLSAAQLLAATYEARIGDGDVLVGSFVWQVAHRNSQTAFLSLDPCSFALDAATWRTQPPLGGKTPDGKASDLKAPNTLARESPAVLGVGPDGRLGLVVDRAGELSGKWAQHGDRTAGGSLSFAIDLPPSTCSRLICDLPEKMTAVVDHGVTYELPEAAPKGFRRWSVDVGGETRIRFRALAEGAAQERRRLTLLRETLTYELTKRGIDLAAALRLDIHNEPLKRVFVSLDPGLQVLAARIGEVDVPWSLVEGDADGKTRVVFDLPEPVLGSGRMLRISAEAPLRLGERRQLPRLHPEDMFWQEGTAQIVVPRPLALTQLTMAGCRQTGVVPSAGSTPGETIELQYYGADAALDVMIDQPEQPLAVDCGTRVEMGAAEMTAQAVAQLKLSAGERFQVRAEVGKQWLIDAVESDADNVSDWSLAPIDDQAQELVVRLKHAVSPRHNVTLNLRGHRATTIGEKLSGADLPMVRFRGSDGWQLLTVHAPENYDLHSLRADEANQREAAKIEPALLQLFPTPPVGSVYVVDDSLARMQLSLASRRPSYSGELAIDAVVEDKLLRETFVIRCKPWESRVDRVLVHFSQARKQPLQWSLTGGHEGQITARKLVEDNDPRRRVGGETWEVLLRLPRPEPFELRAVRSIPTSNSLALALASLPEAAAQQGSISIMALGETGLVIHNRRLKPIPPELLPADRAQTARGTFRYEPSRDAMAAEPAITISLAAGGRQHAGAWAWNLSLDSRYAVGAAASHLAVLQVQAAGRRSIRCDLPTGATLRGVWIDERQIPSGSVDDGEGLRLDLPPDRAFVSVVLHYSTLDALPLLTGSAQAPLPTFDIPVLDKHWVAWTPPGYSLMGGDSRGQADAERRVTWSQRLFGPLGRPEREPVFNPITAEAWRRWADKLKPGVGQADAVDRMLDAIASLGASERDFGGAKTTWQRLLTRWKATDAAAGITLLVDGTSLSLLGLAPDSNVRLATGPDNFSRGMSLIDNANLMLLMHGDKALLTTTVGAAGCRDQWQSPPGVAGCAVASGPLADELSAAAAGKSRRFVSLEAWTTGAAVDRLPWQAPTALCEDLTGSRGWNAWNVNLLEGAAPTVRMVRTAAMQMCGWALCLAILACAALLRSQRAAPWIITAGVLAAAAMLVPAAWSLILAPSLLAVLAYLTLLFTGRLALLLAPGAAATDALTRLAQPQLLAGIALAIAAGAYGARVWAADASPGSRADSGLPPAARADAPPKADALANNPAEGAKTTPRPTTVYTVFVPIDDPRQPASAKYYSIPERLYAEMYAAAAAASNRPGAWLLTNADYRGVLARDSAQRRLALSELKGRFDLRVFEPNATIRLSIDHDSAAFEPDGVRLDGEPIRTEWDSAHGAIVFQIADPGQYRVEVNLLPNTPAHAGGVEVAIPPLAMARIELTAPVDGPNIELTSARGPVAFSRELGMVSGQLGPTARLAARWREAAGVDGAANNFEVDELYWLNVRHGSLTLDARIRLRVSEGRVRQVRLLADPRLRLLPGGAESTPIAETHVSAGDPQFFDLELARPVTDQATFDLRFLLTGASGVGNIRLPRLEVAGARSTRRWMALSVDPALAYEEQPGAEARPLAVPDFSAAWGASESRPNAAFSLPRGDSPLVIATRPREPRAAVEQTLSLGISQGRIAVLFEAASQTLTASSFQLVLEGPAGLQVERVALFEDGLQRVTRWSQDPSGRVTVFLNSQLSGSQQLELHGVMVAPSDGDAPLPMIKLPAAELKKSRVCIYRSPTMLVDLRDLHDITREGDEDVPLNPELGSPVDSYLMHGPESRATLALRPNVPETRGALVTIVQRENESWMAEADLRLDVTQGLVDTIRLEIPPQWGEPFQLDPPMPHEVVTIAGEKKRQLRIRPASAIKDHIRVRARGRLGLAGAERLSAPDIAAPWIGHLDRFVVLPTQLELQQVEWETVGLRAAELPPEFAGRLPALDAVAAYQVVGDNFQATLKSVERMAGAPQVRLADIQLAWLTDGEYYGVAAFDIEPAGSGGCVLETPGHLKLLGVTVGGVPVPLEPAGANQWRLGFVSRHLPQHAEAIFTGRLAAGSVDTGSIRLDAPKVLDLAVERALWTVHAPDPLAVAQVVGSPLPQSPAQAELWRMKSAAALLDVAPEVAADQRSDEIARWYRPWQKQLARSGTLIRREQFILGAGKTAEQEEEARAIEREQANIGERLGAPPDAQRGEPAGVSRPSELIAALHAGDQPTIFAVAGPQPEYSVSLQYAQSSARDGGLRTLAAIGLFATGLAGVWLLSRINWRTISLASGVVVLGLIWWLLLNPSPVGLALVAIGGAMRARRWWLGGAQLSSES